MVQDLNFFFHFFFHYGSGLRIFFHFFSLWLRTFFQKFLQYGSGLRIFSTKISSLWFRTYFFFIFFFTMTQDLDFFSILQILYFSLGLKLNNFFFKSVNYVECKKHQYPIQKALRAVKMHAPSNIMSFQST